MPPLTPYSRNYSFTDFQAGNPSKPLPGIQVDNELENVEQSLGQAIDAIKDIRRSDGKLKNQSVGPDQINPALSLGFTNRGEWKVGVTYNGGDGVAYDAIFYSARAGHVSAADTRPDIAPDLWMVLFSMSDVVITDGSIDKSKLKPDVQALLDSALQPETGAYRIPTFAGAASSHIPVSVATVFVEDRKARFSTVASEPTHALKFQNNGRWFEIDEPVLYAGMAGAKGDGITADDAPLKHCLEYLGYKGGGELRLTKPSYRLSVGNLPLYDHVSVIGSAVYSELKLDRDVVATIMFPPNRLTKPLEGVTLRGLIFNCQAEGDELWSLSAVDIAGFRDLTVQHCVFKGTTGYGFAGQASTANPTYNQPQERLILDSNLFVNCGFNSKGDLGDAIDLKTVNGAIVTNNVVINAADNGFNIRGQDLEIRGNRAYGCGNSGFSIGNGQGLKCNVSLLDNIANDCGVDGIQLAVADVAGSVLLEATVIGNLCTGNGANGIRIYEPNTTTGNLVLVIGGNRTCNNGFNGINQAVPNAKSVSGFANIANNNASSGVGTSGSREIWSGTVANGNGVNGIREAVGANDNRFLGASCKGNVGNEMVVVGSRSMVLAPAGDAPLAIRTGYAENWVNNLLIEGRQTGGGPRISAEGSDASIPVATSTKGSAVHQFFAGSFTTEVMRIAASAFAGTTTLFALVNDGATTSLKQIKVGASGTGPGGAGSALYV